MRCSLPLAPLVLLLLQTSPARAERPHAALALEYAPGPLAARCPEEKLLHEEIGRRIGYDPFDSASPVRLTVTIARSKEAYRVAGTIRDAGKATFTDAFTGPDCASAITMMARALAAELTTVPAPPPAPVPAPLPPPACAALPASLPKRVRFRVAASTSVNFNLSPAVLIGPVVSAGVRYSFLSLALEGRALFAPKIDVSGIYVVPSFYSGAVAACGHHAMLFGCARFELGTLRFEPPRGVKAVPLDVSFAGLGAQVGVEWFFSEHIALNGYADLRVSTRNPTELRTSLDHRIAWSSSRPSPGLGFGLVVSY